MLTLGSETGGAVIPPADLTGFCGTLGAGTGAARFPPSPAGLTCFFLAPIGLEAGS